jgi:hypothetical protein
MEVNDRPNEMEVMVQNTTKAFKADEIYDLKRLFTEVGSFFNELELWWEFLFQFHAHFSGFLSPRGFIRAPWHQRRFPFRNLRCISGGLKADCLSAQGEDSLPALGLEKLILHVFLMIFSPVFHQN